MQLARAMFILFSILFSIPVFAGTPVIPHYDEAFLLDKSDEEREYYLWAEEFMNSLTYLDGAIELPGGKATLNVPEGFYYLSPEDADRVLVEGWGNIKSDELSLGMLFPVRYNPLESVSWGVTIDYEDEGHVTDKNAHKIDYDDMLEELKADTKAESDWRVESGYDSIELVGWAAAPYYDEVGKKLHWAQELRFGGNNETTLNYNLRVLGREGVLRLNFIASISQLEEVEDSLATVLKMPAFTEGNTYFDFNPDMDKVAAYGIGGLVAGKVLAKTGIIAAGLIFFKKFFVIFLVGIGALLKSIFGGKKNKDNK